EALARLGGRALRIEKDELFAERDEARVLHRAPPELGHGEEVELRVRVRPLEVLAQKLHVRFGRFEREVAEARFALRRDQADFYRRARALADFERADREREEIRRKRRRRRETEGRGAAVLGVGSLDLVRVRDHEISLRRRDLEVEGNLERGL